MIDSSGVESLQASATPMSLLGEVLDPLELALAPHARPSRFRASATSTVSCSERCSIPRTCARPSRQAESLPGVRYVDGELLGEVLDPLELALAPEEVDELHPHLASVQVALEVDEMDLEQ